MIPQISVYAAAGHIDELSAEAREWRCGHVRRHSLRRRARQSGTAPMPFSRFSPADEKR